MNKRKGSHDLATVPWSRAGASQVVRLKRKAFEAELGVGVGTWHISSPLKAPALQQINFHEMVTHDENDSLF
ncbi:hypothetical protein D5086_010189 [Populus alba]|uniref:Uncharacterized protein n=1 Tax=Populus alba TaxID=43335 RepID=A0ACC4C9S7_POPAL